MYISRAQINNVRVISNFEFDLKGQENAAGWHVILGDNGSGKSTFIRALALALIGKENAAALRQDWSTWLGPDGSSGSISLSIHGDTDWDGWVEKGRLSNAPIKPRVSFSQQSDSDVVTTNFSGNYTKRTIWGGGKGWFSAAFGPFRRFRGGDNEYDKLYFSHPSLAAHLSAFGEDVALSEALEWIKETQFRALEQDSSANGLVGGILNFINSSDLLPHGAKIAEITSAGVMIVDGADSPVPVDEMSDGYRSVLAMTFELLRAMEAAFGTQTLISELEEGPGTVNLPGVILIDEVDAHLHPAWQRRIGGWFVDHFPKVQFFVTTHSPIICQASEHGSIWRLANPGTDEISGRVTGLDLERLVFGNVLEAFSTEFFGTEVTRSDTSKSMLRKLAELNQKSLKGSLSATEKQDRSVLQSKLPSKAATLAE